MKKVLNKGLADIYISVKGKDEVLKAGKCLDLEDKQAEDLCKSYASLEVLGEEKAEAPSESSEESPKPKNSPKK